MKAILTIMGLAAATAAHAIGMPGPMGPVPISFAKWVTVADTPAEALQLGHQGVVQAVLDIDAKGKIVKCTIKKGSGHRVLDNATCPLILKRGRYQPALSDKGVAIPSQTQVSITWARPK